ncbi:Metallo-dependent hydrolase [Lecanosticta acicola]|uniref:Metallo-dependent hydrolase n=1 Tax=Lecanosticta acicola TaxID=111012 RepID=A0AAI8Z4Y7_9PEZI|nr:Metallo-dependent hydrolase [Lecanosticta acicola]
MARIQEDGTSSGNRSSARVISNVCLPATESGSTWDIYIKDGNIEYVRSHDESAGLYGLHAIDGRGALLAPSLCHPHIHLDKAFLLSHPKYAHLQIQDGDFKEAMNMTGQAKAQFEHADLLERGQRLIDESVAAGVTHMRAFVELDAGVGRKCLDAGIALQERAARDETCHVQLCAFAQLPLFSPAQDDKDGNVIRQLIREAAANGAVHVIGSTPYVETERSRMERNVEWMVDLSIEFDLHLDFHLDYNLDSETAPMVFHVVEILKNKKWKYRTKGKTVVLGHCTRLSLWDHDQWQRLASDIAEAELPISFVGLPTSDLFMMRTGKPLEVRGTLNIPRLVNQYGLNACIGVNNIGNAFTPQGSCDPLSLASQCVGVYQTGTKQDTELLYECISTRAKAAIGVARPNANRKELSVVKDMPADLLSFPGAKETWRTCRSVSEAVYLYDGARNRSSFYLGKLQQRES